jgi:hypothetical protein
LGGKEQSRIQLSNLRQELIPCIPTGRLAVLRSKANRMPDWHFAMVRELLLLD